MIRTHSLAALALGLALGGAAGLSTPAHAQIAAALGKPLPSPDLPVGTVSVRIVAGSSASPIVGTTVTLSVNGTAREARTDSAGRATFAGLPAGAKVVAKVLDEDKKEHASEEFDVPDSGGARVMITTKEWQGGAGGGAPFAGGGGGGMPEPRKLSGEPRPEPQDPAGQLTVRLTYNDLQDAPPEGIAVALIGYKADDSTTYQVQKSGKDGRVQFADLDRSGGTSYFAMTLLPRDGAVDRLMSLPVILDSQVGVRMVLSGEKRASKAPAVDELTRAEPQVATPAGKVRVALEGVADLTTDVSLIDAETKKPLGQAKPQASEPDPSRVRGGSQFTADAKLPAGTLDVEVAGGAGQDAQPLKDIEVKIIAGDGKDAKDAPAELTAVTGTDGTVRVALPAAGAHKAAFTINGKQLVSQAFELAKSGGKLVVRAQWEEAGRPQAMFDVDAKPGQVVFAEAAFRGQRFRSLPFPLLADTGTKITVYAFPRVLLQFQLQSAVEDELLAVQGRFTIQNYSWAPYRGGPDGLVLPLPRGFKGGVVFDPDQSEVSVAAGEGFRIVRPIPPGGRTFHGGFSLGVESGGKVNWSLDLPLGLYESQFVVKMFPGMVVHAPQSAPGEQRTVPQGTFYVIDPISITPKQKMELSIEGMPARAAWRSVVPAIVGVFVVMIMLGGLGVALFKKPAVVSAAANASRRQKLLDELVALERDGSNPERREQVLEELEGLWGLIDHVQIAKVGKRYGSERALASVSLELTARSMCALLGHNGAGKTTLLGILSTLVRPTAGAVAYRSGGAAVAGADVRREIGMLAHTSLCYGELTARENLALTAGLYGVDGSRAAIDAMLDRVDLDKKARDRAARTYSRGMVQRLALARALLTKPSLLLLDEPFTGLDRGGALALGEQLGALRDAGAIVVVVTHDLEAIAGRADHVAILRRGQLVFEERGAYSYDQLKDVYHRHAN